MKAINKFFYALLALATVGMVGCQDAQTYEPGAPEVEGCYDVYFPDAETLEAKGMTQGPTGEVELDPTEKTEFTYTAFRNNTDNDITVPVVISTNTEGKFAVSELKFEAGEDVAEFKVSLLESEIGVTYSLSLSIEDPQYVKQYESNNTNAISVDVTRVKWDYVGDVSFTDGFLSWWLEVNPLTYNARLEVRADSINEAAFKAALAGTGSDAGLAGMYRLVDPYNYGPFAGNVSIGGYALTHNPGTHYLTIDATNPNEVVIPLSDVGLVIDGTGSTSIVCSFAGYYIYAGQESKITEDMYGKIVNGVLTFGTKMLLASPSDAPEAGSLYYANQYGEFALNIAPALNCYELEAPMGDDDGDFAFENVKLPKDAHFYSESQKLVSEVTLEKGKPTVDTDDADRTFVQQYGYVYRLPNLYAEGYPIYFTAALDGTLTSHPNFVEQATGLKQNGYDVYMWIDTASSTFDPETGLMNLVAEFYSYQGKYIISYGVYNEAVSVEAPEFPFAPAVDLKSDFTYSPLFTDTFTSAFQASEWEATLEKGTSVAAGAEAFAAAYGTAYRIPNAYASGYDIYFAAGEDGKVVLPAGYELQATGVSIYGQQAYLQIVSGSMASNGVSFSVKVCNAAGELIMPAVCTESLVTYIWNDVQTGSYYSVLFSDSQTNQVIPFTDRQLQNAEGTDIYRIVDWLEYGCDLMFTWDKKTNKCEIMGMQDTGIPGSAFGGYGKTCICDTRTVFSWFGVEVSWDKLVANGYTQPYFDPELNTFVWEIFYVLPDMGVGYMLNDMSSDGLPVPFTEALELDGEVVEAQWVDVDTGSYYSTLFTDDQDYYIPFQGRKFQNLEGTNKYRVVNFTGAGTDFNFTWDKTTNKCDITGYNDTGVDSSAYGGKGNICVCDLLTFYKANGYNVTWEQLAAANDGVDFQSYFDPEEGSFVFYIIPAVPDMGPSVSLGGGYIFTDYFDLDSAQAAAQSAVKANIMSIPTVKEAALQPHNVVKTSKSTYKVRQNSVSAEKLQPAKQTPVKRTIRENVQLNEKL
ncbi:MAG: hypothetical protein IKY93_07500 [Alistipes sp.]|nr:hypothetical protein [Alistipes sp.]